LSENKEQQLKRPNSLADFLKASQPSVEIKRIDMLGEQASTTGNDRPDPMPREQVQPVKTDSDQTNYSSKDAVQIRNYNDKIPPSASVFVQIDPQINNPDQGRAPGRISSQGPLLTKKDTRKQLTGNEAPATS
jgi:hypothetical protein